MKHLSIIRGLPLIILATVATLVFLLGRAQSQEEVCQALNALHSTYGNSLTVYLSAKGRECLEPAATATPAPPNEEIWSAKGLGQTERTISLELKSGVYTLEASPNPNLHPGGYAHVKDIIGSPEGCVRWENVTFPSLLRIERTCRLYGTMRVYLPYRYRDKRWGLSISRVAEPPPEPKADGWLLRGQGTTYLPLVIVFEPGLYEIEQQMGPPNASMSILSSSPSRCIPGWVDVPGHVKISKKCRVKATLSIHASRDHHRWSYRITKLE